MYWSSKKTGSRSASRAEAEAVAAHPSDNAPPAATSIIPLRTPHGVRARPTRLLRRPRQERAPARAQARPHHSCLPNESARAHDLRARRGHERLSICTVVVLLSFQKRLHLNFQIFEVTKALKRHCLQRVTPRAQLPLLRQRRPTACPLPLRLSQRRCGK